MGVLDMFNKTGGSGDVEGYSESGPGPGIEITAGGRRRRRTLRRKGARKGTRKGSRKHYGGYSYQKQQQGGEGERLTELQAKVTAGTITTAEQLELDGLVKPQSNEGGSRRRKSRHSKKTHNKKTHSKKTRGKKTSAWIKHVLQFAKDNKMKYFQALKDKRCRATYKSSKN